MDSGALINISSPGFSGHDTLIFDSCNIHGCKYMWQGIYTSDIPQPNVLIIRNGTWIQDAIYAVHGKGQYDDIYIQGTAGHITTFNKNYLGVWLDSINNQLADSISVYGTTFQDYGTTVSPGITLKPGGPGTASFQGIYATGIDSLATCTIGNTGQQKNTFDNLYLGVDVENVNCNVYNNLFQNLQIYGVYANGSPFDTSGITNYNLVVGNYSLTNSANTFKNLLYGVGAYYNYTLQAEGNNFDNSTYTLSSPPSTAIDLHGCYGTDTAAKQCLINYNKLNNWGWGIHCSSNMRTNIDITYNRNIINTRQGIFAENDYVDPLATLNINNNYIKQSTFGITANQYSYPNINCNHIYVHNPNYTDSGTGISLTSCFGAYINTDTIQPYDDTTVITCGGHRVVYIKGAQGIGLEYTPSAGINNVQVSKMASNIYAFNNCGNTGLSNNSLTNGLYGLQVADSLGDIGPQGSGPYVNNNNWYSVWAGCNYSTYNNGSYIVASGTTHFVVPAAPPSGVPSAEKKTGSGVFFITYNNCGRFCLSQSIPDPCSGFGFDRVQPSPSTSTSAAKVKAALTDTTSIKGDTALSRLYHFHSKIAAARNILAHTALQKDSTLKPYIHALMNSDAGRIAKIDQMISHNPGGIKALTKMVDSLSKGNSITDNSRKMYKFYLKKTRRDFTGFTKAEINTIRDIAMQCPTRGGPAVYTARAMMHNIDSVFVDYRRYCMPNFSALKSDDPQTNVLTRVSSNSFAVSPNPTRDIVNIEYNTDENTLLIICDLSSRVLNTVNLPGGNGIYTVDIHKLASGTYILKAYGNNCNNCFEKLIQVIK